MTQFADLRERVIILTLLSTGMRVGGLAGIKMKDMHFVEDEKLYKFTVYSDDINWKYITFCTPECALTIQKYLEHRQKRHEETITKNSPLLAQKINFVKVGHMNTNLIQQTMSRLQYGSTLVKRDRKSV
ncbi:MAG: hypothetical protein ACPKPY_03210, partial [Nitrososphaeraceae archaeon]